MKTKLEISFDKWKLRTKNNRINAICKPCWELNYCPYGVLVESFQIDDSQEYGCIIFGHICPVFMVAEPLTETKKQRNISRNIPQKVRYEVLERDGRVCQKCHANLPYDKINFDHIIPWSKGGSSETSNIRILCEKCNKTRGNTYESEFLKVGASECYYDELEIDIEQVRDLLGLHLLWLLMEKYNINQSEEIFCNTITNGETDVDKYMYSITSQLNELLCNNSTFIKIKIKMQMLRYRWGLADGKIYTIAETCNKFKKDYNYYIDLEIHLFRQIGFILKEPYRNDEQYINLKEDIPKEFEILVEEKKVHINLN